MNIRRLIAITLLLAVASLVAFAIYVNIDNLIGAFGDGPPYYGRTTNMDKWANPLPFLFVFDLLVGSISYLAGRWFWKVLWKRAGAGPK